MNKIKDIKEQVLKSFIAKELLEQSVYPTLELICAELLNNYSGLDAFRTMLEDRHLIQQGEVAAYAKFNEIQKFAAIDVETLYRFVDYLEEYFSDAQRGAEQKLTALSRTIKNLQAEADSLLLASEDVNLGEVKVIDFSGNALIDAENTNCFIDYDNQFAKAAAGGSSKTILNGKITSLEIVPLSRGYVSFREIASHNRLQMLDGRMDTYSLFEYKMPNNYSGYAEISIKLQLDKPYKINSLYLDFSSISAPINLFISATAKVNGIYQNLSNYKSYYETADITFDGVMTDFVILNLRTYDSLPAITGTSQYLFLIHELQLGQETYAQVSELLTTELTAEKPYSIMTLYTEENLPAGSDIKYEIEWKDSNNASHVNTIVPYTRSQIDSENFISVLENSKSIEDVKHIDLACSHDYIYGSNFGTDVTLTGDEFQSLDKYDLKLIRAKGGIMIDPDSADLASVVLYCETKKTVDFTLNPGFLDNVQVNTSVELNAGFHTFKFNFSGGLTQYKTFLDNLNINYGACLAEYQTPIDFINRVEDNNYSCYTVVLIGSEYRALVKALGGEVSYDKPWHLEEIVPVHTDLQTAIFGTSAKIRATFYATQDKTPVLKLMKLKLGQ